MNVAIDTNGLYTTQAGVARYIRGLLRGLDELGGLKISYSELAWKVENFSYAQPRRMALTFYRDLIWRNWIGPRQLARINPDLHHSTVGAYMSPPKPLPHVVTVHDLAVLRYPGRFRTWQGMSGRRYVRAAACADEIICISEFTAGEVMELLEVPSRKLSVVYNGHDFQGNRASFNELPPDVEVADDFFLFVGSLEPGKNLKFLRLVYELAAEQSLELPPLYIVGARWKGLRDEGPPPSNWHYLGRQSDEVLVYLYRRALAFLFPSIYEGFGLPVAEAMALGCPVICAPVASLPEVGGSAAVFADLVPHDWIQVMRRIMKRDDFRDACVESGVSQAQKFSWRRCAQETVEVYHKALGH